MAEQNKAEQDGGLSQLREWALAHGSELLRARITEGFIWVPLAEHEWGADFVRDLGQPVADDRGYTSAHLDEPTLEEITKYRDIKRRLGNRGRVVLMRIMYSYGDGNLDPRSEVVVNVVAPTGREVEFSYPCS